ncbi:MAG TPA: hypothetical protein VHT05_11265 [Candidatus Elarobacter sp.]|nr:hypothetical protein [Candidatus Elarobacter sp.]
MLKQLLAALAALTFAAPIAALAQDVPSYAEGQPSYASGEENVHGRIVNFDGAYNLQVRDEQGYVDNVQLHQGTIINPTGITLQPGMVVSILGFNSGSYLAANEVDTPYTFYGGQPWYGGHPWNYWGPTVGLTFFFGNVGWWHGSYFGGPYHYVGGVRVYNTQIRINNVHGGVYQGHNYVAPASRGGYYPNRPVQRQPLYQQRQGQYQQQQPQYRQQQQQYRQQQEHIQQQQHVQPQRQVQKNTQPHHPDDQHPH